MSTEMTENLEALPERVERIEQKLDSLTTSVDTRFDQVTGALVEQRQYTEFAFDRLRREMVERFDRADQRFDRTDQKIELVDQKVQILNEKIDRVLAIVRPVRRRSRPKKR